MALPPQQVSSNYKFTYNGTVLSIRRTGQERPDDVTLSIDGIFTWYDDDKVYSLTLKEITDRWQPGHDSSEPGPAQYEGNFSLTASAYGHETETSTVIISA